MRGWSLRDNNISRVSYGSHSIRVEELAISLTDFSKLEIEVPLLVEDLDPVVVGVSYDDSPNLQW